MARWHVMARLCNRHGLHAGAEIGVAEGRFTAALLKFCPHVKLWAIDDYAPGYKTWMGDSWNQEQQDANKQAFSNVMARYGERIKFIDRPSVEAAKQFDDESLDFVFIDADHSYEAVKVDIATWTPKVRLGGWITGHDYNQAIFPGVVKAVDEAFPEITLGDDYVWMVHKT